MKKLILPILILTLSTTIAHAESINKQCAGSDLKSIITKVESASTDVAGATVDLNRMNMVYIYNEAARDLFISANGESSDRIIDGTNFKSKKVGTQIECLEQKIDNCSDFQCAIVVIQ